MSSKHANRNETYEVDIGWVLIQQLQSCWLQGYLEHIYLPPLWPRIPSIGNAQWLVQDYDNCPSTLRQMHCMLQWISNPRQLPSIICHQSIDNDWLSRTWDSMIWRRHHHSDYMRNIVYMSPWSSYSSPWVDPWSLSDPQEASKT